MVKNERDPRERLIQPHGGYRKLRSFQVAQRVYDLTVRFCDLHVDRRSRLRDQMVQAARSGVQNIAEGSMASAYSRKMEITLTGVARASLEELLLDYQDFLRQKGFPQWARESREAARLRDELKRSDASDLSDPSDAAFFANAMICLVNQASYLLGRQLMYLERRFLEEGGFAERMSRLRRRV
jgi:four helix bundle suffix protein